MRSKSKVGKVLTQGTYEFIPFESPREKGHLTDAGEAY